MRVLVSGSEGYIGAVLGPTLMAAGHDVTGLDTGFHRCAWLYNAVPTAPLWVCQDARDITVDQLRGFDAVVHLADLSNDPLGDFDRSLTFEINHQATVALAEKAKEAGVRRFVYSSSCSVYGAAGATDAWSTEDSPTAPLTAYAECKVLVENDLHLLADDSFSPVYLRNATAFGASPRLRFDIVVNELVGLAVVTGELSLASDGTPWRPFVHIRDISRAMQCCLDAPIDAIHDKVFNVGDTSANYQIRDVAEAIQKVIPGCDITFGDSSGDARNYRADFTRIATELPGFRCDYDLNRGVEELYTVFTQIGLDEDTLFGRRHRRLKQMDYLMATGQVDDRFRWMVEPS
jgi:nucleoside-diphosphate-sugar epimerase